MRLPGKGMSWKEFFKALKFEWTKDRGSNTAAALVFFGVLAVFPFLLFLVSLASVLIDPRQAESLVQQLGTVAPAEVTKILGDRLRDLAASDSAGLLTVGAVGAIWAASSGVVALMEALNIAYDVEESRGFLKKRGIAIGMTLGSAVLGIAAAALVVALPGFADRLGTVGTVLMWLRLPIAALVMMFLWAVIYYVLPDVKQKFKFITPGSVLGVVVWLLASWGFSVYVANFGSYDKNYGALGGVIVLLMWMWISSQVLLLGAEINAIIEHKSPEGKAKGEKEEGDGAAEARPEATLDPDFARKPGQRRPARGAPRPARRPEPAVAARSGSGDGHGRRAPPPAFPGRSADGHAPRSMLTGRPKERRPQQPGLAAALWSAGMGLGVWMLRRGTRA